MWIHNSFPCHKNCKVKSKSSREATQVFPAPPSPRSTSKVLPSGGGEQTTPITPQANPVTRGCWDLWLGVPPAAVSFLFSLLEAQEEAPPKLESAALHADTWGVGPKQLPFRAPQHPQNPTASAVPLYRTPEVSYVFILFFMLENTKLQLCNSIKIKVHILRTVVCTCEHTNLEMHQKQGLVRINSNYTLRRQP